MGTWSKDKENQIVGWVNSIALKTDNAEIAFEELRRSFQPLVFSELSKRLYGQFSNGIEDVDQNVWLKIWRRARVIKAAAEIVAYIKLIIKQSIHEYLKKESQYALVETDAEIYAIREKLNPSQERTVFTPEVAHEIQQNITNEKMKILRPKERVIVILYSLPCPSYRELEHRLGQYMPTESDRVKIDKEKLQQYRGKPLTHNEIAEILGDNPDNIRRRYSNAKKKIKTQEIIRSNHC